MHRLVMKLALILPLLLTPCLAAQEVPKQYDMRKTGGVTPIKAQRYGTCWTHGTIAAIESNLIVSGTWKKIGGKDLPLLSEYHLDWWNGFNRHKNDDLEDTAKSLTGLTVHQGGDYRVSAAYIGGTTDLILGLITDIFLVLPQLPLMIVIASYFRSSSYWVLIAVIVVTGWAYGARQLRSQALSLRHREFLEAARIRGERTSRIILFELLPTMTSLIVANFLGAALYAVLSAAGLQFIGLGNIQEMSWGTMLYWAENNEAMMSGAPLWILAPGLCIALLGAAFALVNYGFDEIGNPALRATRRKRGRRVVNS